MTTTKKFGAGTDAKVYVELHGSNSSSGRIMLTKSKTNKNAFESGNTDVFEVVAPDVGILKKIRY